MTDDGMTGCSYPSVQAPLIRLRHLLPSERGEGSREPSPRASGERVAEGRVRGRLSTLTEGRGKNEEERRDCFFIRHSHLEPRTSPPSLLRPAVVRGGPINRGRLPT